MTTYGEESGLDQESIKMIRNNDFIDKINEKVDDGIYIGEGYYISKDYKGEAVTLSMEGSCFSSTHISMTLTPAQQRTLINWFCKNRKDLVEDALLLEGVLKTKQEQEDEQ